VERRTKAELAIFDELVTAPAFARHSVAHVDLHQAVGKAVIAATYTVVDRFSE
jgi:hypothetical protein